MFSALRVYEGRAGEWGTVHVPIAHQAVVVELIGMSGAYPRAWILSVGDARS